MPLSLVVLSGKCNLHEWRVFVGTDRNRFHGENASIIIFINIVSLYHCRHDFSTIVVLSTFIRIELGIISDTKGSFGLT